MHILEFTCLLCSLALVVLEESWKEIKLGKEYFILGKI